MMRALLAAAVLILSFASTPAQNCTPDPQYTQPGIYPDSATNFAPAYANTPYSQLITVVIPQDTQVLNPPFPPFVWDSTVLVSMTGLPPGFTYACWNNSTSPNRCSWRGNTTGCCIITGNPTINDTGTYTLNIVTHNFLAGSTTPNPYTITYYKIRVNGPMSVAEPGKPPFEVSQNAPNPASSHTEFMIQASAPGMLSVTVYNMVGDAVYSGSLKSKPGANRFYLDTRSYAEGVYLCAFSNGDSTVTRRMVVSR
ncbi:MAG: T9SS type A sorting domain-containing protein [Bacteroidota bacterium]